ncbi:putative psoralen synthase [Helianthus debilis subsp. tardiflorus]
MPYLKAVLKENLQLHSPNPLLPRESTQDVELLGYDIPSGTQVIINAWAISRDPSVWDAPEEFRPERFLNKPIDYKGFHFEFLPFGAGRRGCPSIQFAMTVNELVLANLVYKFDVSLMGEEELDMSETFGITVHKKSPILVSTTPRS